MDLGLKPGDVGYKASQNKIQPSETRTTTAKEESLELRIEQLESTVAKLTEEIKILHRECQQNSTLARNAMSRARIRT